MKASRILTLAVVAVAFLTATSFGQLLLAEPFKYPNGPLSGNGVDANHIWITHSGIANQMQVSTANGALVVQATQTEDVSVPIGITLGAGQKLYAAFDVTVNSTGSLAGTSPAYFAHFRDSGTANFSARAYAVPPTAGGLNTFTYGLRGGSGVGAAATWASDFSLGTKQRLVIEYDFGTGLNKLWVNPVNEASISISDTVVSSFAIQFFALREAGYSTATGVTETVDSLGIATDFMTALNAPEPATATLLGLGILALVRRRR